MAYILRLPQRAGLLSRALTRWPQCQPLSTSLVQMQLKPGEDYWTKNARLQRPVSPHLTIYEFQITNVLSGSHRLTGLGMSLALTTFAVGVLVMPGSFPSYVESIGAMHLPPALITSTKFMLTWPFTYHLCNGLRHLAWDLGFGFNMKTLYLTGYAVVAGSVALSAGLALM